MRYRGSRSYGGGALWRGGEREGGSRGEGEGAAGKRFLMKTVNILVEARNYFDQSRMSDRINFHSLTVYSLRGSASCFSFLSDIPTIIKNNLSTYKSHQNSGS